jgi:1,4-alpha-glucan branching enzyme
MKWMMGWMHDTFSYFKISLNERLAYQNILSFSMMYYYHEKFMLPLSHDEVVHGKSPLIYKMPGTNDSEKFANLKLLYTYMYTHPGTKLLFMGNEFGQTNEWNENKELNWSLLQHNSHQGLQNCVRDLSYLYCNEKAMFQLQFSPDGFEWVELNKRDHGIIIYKRKGIKKKDDMLVILNVSKHSYTNWKIRVNGKLLWKEIFNSNNKLYFGNGEYLNDNLKFNVIHKKKKITEVELSIPALSGIILI